MSFSSENGYIPLSVETIMSDIRERVNTQFGVSYTEETFAGTGFYQYFYPMVQRVQENEIKTSEIVQKIQEYFDVTNEIIQRPNTTPPGMYDYFLDAGWKISVKPIESGEEGEARICVDVDDSDPEYDEKKAEICELLKDCLAAGVVSVGTESEFVVIQNAQSFEFSFNLPDRIPTLLRVTLPLSDNNQFVIQSPEWIKEKILENIAAKYSLGLDFQPQRYLSLVDVPWAASILFEYSIDDGENWETGIYESEYDELLTFALGDIEIVEE